MKKIIFFYLLIFFKISSGQNIQFFLEKADKNYKEKNYYNAFVFYEKVIIKKEYDLKIIYKYAEVCRMCGFLEKAKKNYEKLINTNINLFPDAVFWMAEIQKNEGFYWEAQKNYKIFYEKNINRKSDKLIKAEHEIIACYDAIILKNESRRNKDKVKIEVLENINSPYSDLSPRIINNNVLFITSVHAKKIGDSTIMESNILKSEKNNKIWKTPEVFANYLKEENFLIGNISFTNDKKTFFFNKCPVLRNKQFFKCEIYKASYENDSLINIKKLPNTINEKKSNNIQASFSEINGEKYLFFVSDRKGGFGKYDIWVSKIVGDNFSNSENLGEIINSPEDELTPFFHQKSKVLYFSSRWHKNLGGLDIFKTKGNFNSWNEPENLNFPINSSNDDLYFFLDEKEEFAYFSSNRVEKISDQVCCNDIYFYENIKKENDILEKKNNDIIISNVDNDENKENNNEKKIKKKIKKLKKLLPITLFFDNDRPNPNTKKIKTNFNYKTTYIEYIKLQNIFRKKYSENSIAQIKEIEKKEINYFFEENIKKGYKNLLIFTKSLQFLLEKNKIVQLELKAYASPLNNRKYNKKLSKRRIHSLINFFNEYENGYFKKYLEEKTLILKEIAMGEDFSKKNISDNREDKKHSVFSPEASFERRIEIISISIE
ncbi:MAG: hypothetical protein B6I24_01160 [Bacteroidetes bacterium 4572_128]|nr:MAG: hypothetical protein B6I24_01160 [Bacteroidetes bacterium 4572_128]